MTLILRIAKMVNGTQTVRLGRNYYYEFHFANTLLVSLYGIIDFNKGPDKITKYLLCLETSTLVSGMVSRPPTSFHLTTVI